MFSFVLTVALINLLFMCLLFSMRHKIAITTPVLLMTVLVAFLCAIAFPYLIVILDYPQLVITFIFIILFCSVLLTLVNKKCLALKLNAAPTNHPDSKEEQTSDLKTANEVPLLETATTATAYEQFEQSTANVMCAQIEQVSIPTIEPETEPEATAAKNKETSATKSELIHPLLEITDSLPGVTEEKNGLPDNPDLSGHVKKPEPPVMEIKPDPELGPMPEPVPESVPVPVLELAPMPEPVPVLEPESTPEPVLEPVPVPEPAFEPAAVFTYDKNKNTPPQTNHRHQDFSPGEVTEPADEVTEPDSDRVETNRTDLNRFIELGFASKQNGDYLGAATTFLKALQMRPNTKLALLLAVEVSEIYREAGQFWQATEILNTLIKSRRADLDGEKVEKLELKINQLQESH
ncbi:hypothetical protein ABDB91_02605 [Desulfoscipio sp. XC116]|uniref:hypothetical protein n=1 Tax=Desulfoscipio sp. XC116 TaxID=3144975 RepID=UPI00325BEB23